MRRERAAGPESVENRSRFNGRPREATENHSGWCGAGELDVWETEDDLVYAFDVPGVPEDKIAVEIEDNTLTVSGSRERAEKLDDERFFRYERRFGDFTRSVALPQGCGEGEAQAHYANGTLEVHVKKPEQSKPRRVPVMTTVEAALPSSTN